MDQASAETARRNVKRGVHEGDDKRSIEERGKSSNSKAFYEKIKSIEEGGIDHKRKESQGEQNKGAEQ